MIYSQSYYKATEGDYIRYDRRRDWYWAIQEIGMFATPKKSIYLKIGYSWYKPDYYGPGKQWKNSRNRSGLKWSPCQVTRHRLRHTEPKPKKVFV